MRNLNKQFKEYVGDKNYEQVSNFLAVHFDDPDFDINHRAFLFGKTALQKAVEIGSVKMCKLLVDNGAEVTTSLQLNNLIDVAKKKNHEGVCKFLVEQGLTPNR